MDELKRIPPQDAWHETQGENETYALLVFASESDDQWRQHRLKGSIARPALEAALDGMARDRKIIFYATGPDDEPARQAAEACAERGFRNVAILWGGYQAWKAAGFPTDSAV